MASDEAKNAAANARNAPVEPSYGGYTRFELELEFVQCLANPSYLNNLGAHQKLLEDPKFIAYLDYLQYFAEPRYARFLTYPGPTLRNLELLQQPQFRKDIVNPALAAQMTEEMMRMSVDTPSNGTNEVQS